MLKLIKGSLGNVTFSQCEKYRYLLTRHLPCMVRWSKPVLFIMLNPSIADADQNDPTIRRCISFAEREYCAELRVVNLFALRATDPKELKKHTAPIGVMNDAIIKEETVKAMSSGGLIIAAWGAHKFAHDRAKEVLSKLGPFKCLGFTKSGSPRHPLYVKSDQSFVEIK